MKPLALYLAQKLEDTHPSDDSTHLLMYDAADELKRLVAVITGETDLSTQPTRAAKAAWQAGYEAGKGEAVAATKSWIDPATCKVITENILAKDFYAAPSQEPVEIDDALIDLMAQVTKEKQNYSLGVIDSNGDIYPEPPPAGTVLYAHPAPDADRITELEKVCAMALELLVSYPGDYTDRGNKIIDDIRKAIGETK